MLCLDGGEVRPQSGDDRRGKHRDTVLSALAVADHDRVRTAVAVLDAQPTTLEDAEPRTVEQECHDPRYAGHLLKNRPDLGRTRVSGMLLVVEEDEPLDPWT